MGETTFRDLMEYEELGPLGDHQSFGQYIDELEQSMCEMGLTYSKRQLHDIETHQLGVQLGVQVKTSNNRSDLVYKIRYDTINDKVSVSKKEGIHMLDFAELKELSQKVSDLELIMRLLLPEESRTE